MSLRKIDFKKYLVFGFLFIETTVGEDQELNQILTSDLRKYIKLKKNHKEAVQKVSFLDSHSSY